MEIKSFNCIARLSESNPTMATGAPVIMLPRSQNLFLRSLSPEILWENTPPPEIQGHQQELDLANKEI